MGREHELKAPKVLVDFVEREEKTTMWAQECTRMPAMVRDVLGDGGKLAFITPLMTRPNYYAILVHSTWTEDDLAERSELILRTIEDSFGNHDDDVEEEDLQEGVADEDGHHWPALHGGGHCWGFITDYPDDVMQATREDLARQMHEQKAFFMGEVRITPGTLLDHPEFGKVQARLNDELGWYYCRRGVMQEFRPGDVGYATDFTGVTVSVRSAEDGPNYDMIGIHRRMSTPTTTPTVTPARRARP